MKTRRKRYDRPVEVAPGIHWVGFHDGDSNLHCNPYLIIEGDKAVLIDGGSRPDFPVVMRKILQTGIAPEQIVALVYQHPDPDLCGSMANMVDLCANEALTILSDRANNDFLSFYLERERRGLLRSLDDLGMVFSFNGRELRFFKTPFAHTAGSLVTYDTRTRTLFTSDLFGSYSQRWDLFLRLDDRCRSCDAYDTDGPCAYGKPYCPLTDLLTFHRQVMPSEKALHRAMGVIGGVDAALIAPQHGSVIDQPEDIAFLTDCLARLTGVGCDGPGGTGG